MQQGIFKDLTVLELATVLAGPAVGSFFAELGARVIKVEPPGGDITRTWRVAGEPTDTPISAYFSAVNWGKESVAINLKDPKGQRLVHKLASQADIVLTNYRNADAKKLGVDYQTLASQNGRIIYAHLSGYGTQNDRAGYDALVQAESGFMHLNGTPDGPATKLPVALMDLLAAHQMKEAILTALYVREKSGQGQLVEVSLLQAGISALANQAASWLWLGISPKRAGSEHPAIAPYGSQYSTADGKQLVLAVGSDRQFADLCTAIGLPHVALDAPYKTNPARVSNRVALHALLTQAIAGYQLAPLLADLHAKGVPAGGVHDLPRALAQPEASPLLLKDALGKLGLRTVAWEEPAGWQRAELTPPPTLGQHTDEIAKQDLELYTNEVERLRAAGVLG